MSFIITLLAAVFVFSAVIAIHEFGHFAVAKLCGVQVNEFSIGMGPVLLKKRPPLLSDYAAFRLRVAGKALQGARRGHGDAAAFEREISIWEAIIHGDGTRHS